MVVTGLETETTGGTTLLPGNTQQVLGKDDFLNLLVAQLQNQDPLNPMDSTQFTSQLAQFSSLEQLSNINTGITSLQDSQEGNGQSLAVGYIGKHVLADGDVVMLGTTGSTDLHFELASDAAAAQINIYDAAGEYVRTLETASLTAGRQTLTWDGKDGYGRRSGSGPYSFEVLAVDADGSMVNTNPLVSTPVIGVRFEDGRPLLLTEGQAIPMKDVREVFTSSL